jgi:hypothetical protein
MPKVHLGSTGPPDPPICATPDCAERPKWKGLCDRCYRSAKRLVDAGKTTWEDLASLGLASIDGAEDKFTAAFNKRKKVQ